MGIFRKYSTWFLTLFVALVTVSLAGCLDGSSNGNSSTSGDSPVVTSSPTVTSSAPANDASAVSTNSKIIVVFDRAMKAATLSQSSFTLQGTGEFAIVGGVTYNADTLTATLTPNGDLTASTDYTATLTTAVEDESGTALANNVEWVFTTGDASDDAAPTVTANSPTGGGVLRNTKVSVSFSEAIDPATLTASSFELKKDVGDVVVSGSLRYLNPTTVVFSPATLLDGGTAYTLTLAATLADLAGNSLALTSFGFTTGAEVSASPAAVDLGTAGNYVILAKTGISTTGTTHITGDIAVSPEALTAITGFGETLAADGTFATSPLVTGNLFAANMTSPTPDNLTIAVGNMETAYTNAAGRVDPDFTELGAGEIGGLTLDPGLYKWGTGVLVTTDVTLNGSATDVWIFQIGQDLKLEDGKKVVLTGGALPENVFWQVAGEVTLQASTTFNGIILSQTGIVVRSGAVINGRALAQTAVTLIANDVNAPGL